MTIEEITTTVAEFVRAHKHLAPYVVGLLAFGESIAFVSLLIPATAILLALGALIGAVGLEFWPIWLGACVGAVLGDWVSYMVGYRFKDRALAIWPLSRYPAVVEKGQSFFVRYGPWGLFAGRFFGPARAVAPLTAGIFAMPFFLFQSVNVASAMVWSFTMLAPGAGLLAALR